MPVGCLSSRHVDSTLYLPQQIQTQDQTNGNTAEAGGAETISLMQQTLLIQIFRVDISDQADNRILQGEGDCPTCQAFSPQCCQEVEGLEVFQEFQENNVAQTWNLQLVKAVVGLKYQGYVCPGILVTLTDSGGVGVMQEAWSQHALATPPGFTIYRLGLSGGCSVTPFTQSVAPSLPEALCVILQKLRAADCVADINTVLARLNRDFPALTSNNLPATVHAALGSLIKKRKVYYTGKGYFLVSPDPSALPKLRPKTVRSVRRSTRENAAQTEFNLSNGHTVYTPPAAHSWSSSSPAPSSHPATPLQHHRQLLGRINSISPPAGFSRHSPRSPQDISPRHSPLGQGAGGYPVPPLGRITSSSSSSPNSSTDSSMNESSSPRSQQTTLERSQSLRISKKSLKQMSKGGSLRLSKKDALAIMAETDEKNKDAESDERTSPSPKKMERKNSFLGRIFGRKKSSGSPTKKEIQTFSAQFPPPELELQMSAPRHLDLQTAETQTPPHVRRKPVRPGLPSPPLSTGQLKSGPNGNYVMYERSEYGTRSNPSGRPLPQSPPTYTSASEQYEANSSHIYSQPSLYGTNKPPPPAYSSAPPYQPKSPPPVSQKPTLITSHSSPAPQRPSFISSPNQRPSLVTSPLNHRPSLVTSPQNQRPSLVSSPHKSTLVKQVHFAATPRSNESDSPRSPPLHPNVRSPQILRNATSRTSESSSSNSGHSSLSGPSSLDSVLYDDTLIVIEASNHELERRLDRTQLSNNRVDTIHNNRHLDQEVIYEDDLADLSRSSSQSTLKPDSVPDHPSLSDLGSIADLSAKFQSLTARKLMAGLSISSIDTLLEVNAAADSKLDKLDESTETIDFGVI